MKSVVVDDTPDIVALDETPDVMCGVEVLDVIAVPDGTGLAEIAGTNPTQGPASVTVLGFEPIPPGGDGHEKHERVGLSVSIRSASYDALVVAAGEDVADAAGISVSLTALYNEVVILSGDVIADSGSLAVSVTAGYSDVTALPGDEVAESATLGVAVQSAAYVDVTT